MAVSAGFANPNNRLVVDSAVFNERPSIWDTVVNMTNGSKGNASFFSFSSALADALKAWPGSVPPALQQLKETAGKGLGALGVLYPLGAIDRSWSALKGVNGSLKSVTKLMEEGADAVASTISCVQTLSTGDLPAWAEPARKALQLVSDSAELFNLSAYKRPELNRQVRLADQTIRWNTMTVFDPQPTNGKGVPLTNIGNSLSPEVVQDALLEQQTNVGFKIVKSVMNVFLGLLPQLQKIGAVQKRGWMILTEVQSKWAKAAAATIGLWVAFREEHARLKLKARIESTNPIMA